MSLSSRMGAGVAVAALSGLAILGVQSPASAAPGDCPAGQHYAPGSGCVADDIAVDHPNFYPGGAGHISGAGFRARSSVAFSADSVSIATLTATAAGTVDHDFTMPDLSAGPHSLVLSGVRPDGSPLTLSVPVTVLARSGTGGNGGGNGGGTGGTSGGTSGGTTTSGSSLPRTGLDVALVGVAGVALVGAGAGSVVLGRRRRIA